jgi:hypothetical protein
MVTLEQLRPALITPAPPPPAVDKPIKFELLQRRKQAITPFLMRSDSTLDPQESMSLPLVTDTQRSKRARLCTANPSYMVQVMKEEEKAMRQFGADRPGEGWEPFLEQGLAIITAQLAFFAAQVPEDERKAMEESGPKAGGGVDPVGQEKEQVEAELVKDESGEQQERAAGAPPLGAAWPSIAGTVALPGQDGAKAVSPKETERAPVAEPGLGCADEAQRESKEGKEEPKKRTVLKFEPTTTAKTEEPGQVQEAAETEQAKTLSAVATEWKPSAAAVEWSPASPPAAPSSPGAVKGAEDTTGLAALRLPLTKEQKEQEKEFFFFYQECSADNQSSPYVYLHPFNARCLLHNVGGCFLHLPRTVEATIVEVESFVLTRDVRKRYLYLGHLPLFCEVQFCELDLFDSSQRTSKKDSIKVQNAGAADATVEEGEEGGRFTSLGAETRARFGDEWKSRQAARRRRHRLNEKEEARMKRQAEIYGNECAADAEARARLEGAYVKHEDLMKMVESGELFAGPRPGEDPAAVGAAVSAGGGEDKEEAGEEGAGGGEEESWPSFAQIAKNKHARQHQQQQLDDESAFPSLGGAKKAPQPEFPGLGDEMFPDMGNAAFPGLASTSASSSASTSASTSALTNASTNAPAASSDAVGVAAGSAVAEAAAAGEPGAWGAQGAKEGAEENDWEGWEQDGEGTWYKAWGQDEEGNWYKVDAEGAPAADSESAGAGKKKKKAKKVTLFANATRRY